MTSVVAGADGSVRLRGEDGPGASVAYRVLGAKGDLSVMVRVPRQVTLQFADGGHVWGFGVDANDAPIVVRYRIERR